MIKNKLQVIYILILIATIIATILITKNIIQKNDSSKIEELERQNEIYKDWTNKLEVTIDSLLVEGKKSEEETDSIELIIKDLEKKNVIFETELKNIKGKYRNYSSDSLYKELMKRYYEDISINAN